ncbi:MAG: aminotransferase class I/II-fold pyridoxal phosphate-dependent enzyme, partial [Burkholderiales bacterium]
INDEAYEYFTYGSARHFSPASIPDSEGHTVSLFSFSKAYGFASWRIGYMVVPVALFDPIVKIQDTNLICPPVISQFAAIAMLSVGSGYCKGKLRDLAAVRERVLSTLGELRGYCTVVGSEGAFYCYVKVDTAMQSMELTQRLVREYGVAVIPGTAFGMDGDCTLRVSYGALEQQTVMEGIGRFVRGVQAIIGA